MFQINAKTDYGLLIMLELAKYEGRIVPSSPLAKHLGVSSAYLSQIARSLQKKGLMASKEGSGGGYYLAKPAKAIKVWEILEALSGELKVRCAHGAKSCPHFHTCGLKSAWPLLLNDIKSGLSKRTLAGLLKEIL